MTEFLLISADDFGYRIQERFKDGGGMYRLHCFSDEKFSDIMPIQRALGVDRTGILYIGSATRFMDRVIALKKGLSLEYRSEPHICGRRYHNDKHKRFRLTFPFTRLCISLELHPIPTKREQVELQRYCIKFGEAPPLNSFE